MNEIEWAQRKLLKVNAPDSRKERNRTVHLKIAAACNRWSDDGYGPNELIITYSQMLF